MHATYFVVVGGSAGCVMAARLPEVARTNSNIPTIMIAERVAEMVRQRCAA